MQVESHTGTLPAEHSYVSVAPENVVADGGEEGRGREWADLPRVRVGGQRARGAIHGADGCVSATETNLMEKPEGAALQLDGDSVKATIHPYEILTVRVDYGR